jgi:hypothetical protein
LIVPLQLLRQAEETKRIFNIVLGSIAAISLLVGGIGIMNIMLATVTERTRGSACGVRSARNRKTLRRNSWWKRWSGHRRRARGVALGVLTPLIVSQLTDMRTIVTPISYCWPSALPALSALSSVGIRLARGRGWIDRGAAARITARIFLLPIRHRASG